MPGRNREAQLASDALFLARGDPFDVDAGGLQTVCEYFEVAVAANLEADPIKTGHIRLAQDDAVSIEFVEPAEKCPVTRTTEEFKPRSEGSRVGKQGVGRCRSRWWPVRKKKN